VVLTLAPEGVRLHEQSLALIREVDRGVFAGVPEDRLRTAARVLSAVIASVVREPRELQMLLTFSREPTEA
jgi:hypothetical protein